MRTRVLELKVDEEDWGEDECYYVAFASEFKGVRGSGGSPALAIQAFFSTLASVMQDKEQMHTDNDKELARLILLGKEDD